MPFDTYDPCPCGSEKKLKFCCQALVVDMQKVIKLQENDQTRMALQQLERLEKSHPGNPWIVTSCAGILLGQGNAGEAKKMLENLIEGHPNHLFALTLYATAVLAADGYPAAKPAICLSFQRCSAAFPGLVGTLAMVVASLMFESRKYMASRQHLALVMRLVPEEERQDVFLRLLDFDSNRDLPYPLRSVHQLAHDTGAGGNEKEVHWATLLSNAGCWEPAAKLYEKLAEQEPENANAWYNTALCRAWDGDERRAVDALRQAARLHSDFHAAVECETIAQLLEINSTEDRVEVVTSEYSVQSVSKLLTLLEQEDRLARLGIPPRENADGPSPVGLFQILDRLPPSSQDTESLRIEAVPNVLAHIEVFDEVTEEDRSGQALLTGFEGEKYETARNLFEAAANGEIEANVSETQEDVPRESVPREQFQLHWRWYFSPKTPTRLRRNLEQEQWQRVIGEVWLTSPLIGLGGKTPLEAAGDSELKLPLTASVFVFDAFCDRNRYSLDIDALFSRLDLDKSKPIEVSQNMPLNAYSAMQLHRLPVGELSDDQLTYTLNRALLIHHGAFLYEVLTEVLQRPSCAKAVDLDRVYSTLTDLCRDQNRPEEALQWAAKGKEFAKTQEKAFENTLQWELSELGLRLENPDDPGLGPLLKHLAEHYGPKIPQLNTYLASLLEAYGVKSPWDSDEAAVITDVGSRSTTEDAIWTPSSPQETPGGEQKLWIPGQD